LRIDKADAGMPQTALVSGRSIEAVQFTLESYLPRDRELAEVALTWLANYRKSARCGGRDADLMQHR
jgi:hypothetical protein